MIKFKTLSIKNFLSYGESPTVIKLDTIGTTLIVGEDLDNEGSNGSGKTTWINALLYALYGKPLSNISMNNLVNNINNKNMRVEVEFEKNDTLITIRRARKEKGGGNYAKVFIRPLGTKLNEKKHDKTPDSINNINDFILEHLGIPYELFIRVVTFTATHVPFLDLPLRQQSDMMEELFRLTQLSIKAESLKAEMKDTKQTLEIKIKHNEQLEKEHERHNKQLASARERVNNWEDECRKDINVVEKELIKYETIPIKEQEKLYKQVNKLKEILVNEKEKQKNLETLITEINTEYMVARTHLKTIKNEKEKMLNWKDENIIKIADCKGATDELLKIEEINEQLTLHQNLENLTEYLKVLTEKEDTLKTNIKDTDHLLNKAEEELVHLEEAKCPYCLQRYENANIKIDECTDSIKLNQQLQIDNSNLIDITQKNIKVVNSDTKTITNDIKYTITHLNEQENCRENYIKKLEVLFNEKCPHGDGATVSTLLDLISITEKETNQLKADILKKGDQLINIDEIVKTINKELKACENEITISSLNELYEIKNKISQHKIKIKELKTAINPYLEPLKELEDIKLDKLDMNVINELNNLITHQNYLVKLLTKKDSFIRKTLLNKNLAFLNQRLQHYLSALGLPHKVEFTHEMTANISQFGRELDFGNLSSGQKARVNIGLSFSFRDVLQKSHDSINVCLLDEILDTGLDTTGIQNAARMLKRKARDEDLALYIISHRDELSGIFDNKIIVQMKNGFSSVKL